MRFVLGRDAERGDDVVQQRVLQAAIVRAGGAVER
jgi:hypothetical protein